MTEEYRERDEGRDGTCREESNVRDRETGRNVLMGEMRGRERMRRREEQRAKKGENRGTDQITTNMASGSRTAWMCYLVQNETPQNRYVYQKSPQKFL